MRKLLIQFIKFGLVGLVNTAISLGIYYLFVAVNPGLYLWGNTLGWIVSVLNAFYWGNKIVFKNESNTCKDLLIRLAKSYCTYGATYLLSQILLYMQVTHWDVSAWLAPLINLLVTIPLNFVMNKYWTFK